MSNTKPDSKDENPLTKRCSRCGAEFGCGIDQASCWCSELPPLARQRLDTDRDCLCPVCLRAALAAQENDSA